MQFHCSGRGSLLRHHNNVHLAQSFEVLARGSLGPTVQGMKVGIKKTRVRGLTYENLSYQGTGLYRWTDGRRLCISRALQWRS